MRSFFLLLLALLIGSCDLDNFLIDNFLVDTSTKLLPAEVQLHLGQSAVFPHEGYTITFEQVTEDSRCPIGLKCFWAGDGAARLKIKDNVATVTHDTLHTTLEPHSVQFQHLRIRLKSLDPYPVHDMPVDTSKYVVTLEINQAAADSLGTK